MEGNVIVLIIAGCCLFSFCVGLFIRVYYGPDAAKTILTKGLIKDALAGFEFDTSSSLPNIRKRISNIRPQSFDHRLNFSAPPSTNIDQPQDKDDVQCSALCFDSEGCTGYSMENGKCQLKGNVTIINYEKGKEIHVSSDVGGTKYGHVPRDLLDKTQQSMWSKTWTLAEAGDNCWSAPECTGFTYLNGVATMYGNALVLDSGSTGNTYIKFSSMGKSGFGQKGTTYTDPASAGGFSIESQFFKSDNGFAPPPALPEGSLAYKYYENDIKYFKKAPESNWNAGKDRKFADPKLVAGAKELNYCANLCMSNSSCKSFVFKSGSNECYFRSDLSRDNNRKLVCQSKPLLNDDVNKCQGGEELVPFAENQAWCSKSDGGTRAVAQCWTEEGSHNETGSQTYWKLQDSMDKQCPEACEPNAMCQAVKWNKNDCSIFEFTPTVKAPAANFTTQWKFDYFPG